MKFRIVILVLLLTCLFISGCQAATDPLGLTTGNNSLEVPTQSIGTPSTGASIPNIPVTIPTTPPTTPPTQPIEPPVNQKVTPINTYVSSHNLDGTPNYDGRVSVPYDTVYPDLSNLQKGEVILSDNVRAAIAENHPRSVFYVTVRYMPSIDWELGEYPYGEAYDSFREDVMKRFEDAGYPVFNGCQHAKIDGEFFILASAEQLLEMNCGDDMAIYIYVAQPCF